MTISHFKGAVLAQTARRLDAPPPGTVTRKEFSDSVWARKHRMEAVKAFRQALKANPDNKMARFELGVCLERLGQVVESMAELRVVVQQDSLHGTALNYLGYMLVEQNQDLDYAGKLIQKALDLEPANGAFLDSKGWWHYRRGEYTEAKAFLEKAHAAMPEDTTILEHLAIINELLGDAKAARAAWKHVLQLDPAHAEAKRKIR
jgi:Flp pilus assembly protein TadD